MKLERSLSTVYTTRNSTLIQEGNLFWCLHSTISINSMARTVNFYQNPSFSSWNRSSRDKMEKIERNPVNDIFLCRQINESDKITRRNSELCTHNGMIFCFYRTAAMRLINKRWLFWTFCVLVFRHLALVTLCDSKKVWHTEQKNPKRYHTYGISL